MGLANPLSEEQAVLRASLPWEVHRIRLFGRVDACRVPDPAVRQRFLA